MPPLREPPLAALGAAQWGEAIAQAREVMMAYAQSLTHNVEAARDLTQEAILHALAKRQRYIERGRLNPWLCRIVHNLWVNGLRRSRRRHASTTYSLDRPMRSQHDGEAFGSFADGQTLRVDGEQLGAMLKRDLHRCFQQMPLEQVEVLMMVGIDGMRYGEVAAILGIPVGTVRSRLGRGRVLLRDLLNGKPRRPRKPRKPYHCKKRAKTRRHGRTAIRRFIRAAEPALA
jgi:RNA polymerase sigma-70 factor, ECF subfamily